MVEEPRSPNRAARERLLLVEDNVIVGRVLEQVLQPFCHIQRATGATEAIGAIERAPFAIILADFHLSDGDGAAVLRRARGLRPAALRLLMSGGDVPGSERWLAEGLVDGWLPKPFSAEVFGKVVRGIARWGRPFGDLR